MKASILSATLLSCTVFSCLTLPLVTLGSNSVEIEFQKEHFFAGKLKDVASPYLGVAALVSLGAGAVSLSMSGWRNSSQKSSQIEKQLSQLQQELQEKEKQLEEVQLSEPYLQASGLNYFLDSESTQAMPSSVAMKEAAQAQAAKSYEVAASPVEVVKPLIAVVRDYKLQPEVFSATSAETPVTVSVTPFHAAQSQAVQATISHAELKAQVAELSLDRSPVSTQSPISVLAQVSELQSQLKQMAAHMESLQNSLQETSDTTDDSSAVDPSTLVIEHLHRRLARLESDWVQQRAS